MIITLILIIIMIMIIMITIIMILLINSPPLLTAPWMRCECCIAPEFYKLVMITMMMMMIHLVEATLEEVDIVEVVKLDRKLNRCLEFAHTHPTTLGITQ